MSEIKRAQLDRRSAKDRRKKFKLSHFFYRGEEEEISKNGDPKPKQEATGLGLASGRVCVSQI